MSDISKKKLSLNKETILHLTNVDLANAVGGGLSDILSQLAPFVCRGKAPEPGPQPPQPRESGMQFVCDPQPPGQPRVSGMQFVCLGF